MIFEQSYYNNLGSDSNNIERDDVSLIPNCVGICVLPNNFDSASRGRHDYYLQYLANGEMEVRTENGIEIMRPGQVILYYPHTIYHYSGRKFGKESEKLTTDKIVYYWVHFTGADAGRIVSECGIPDRKIITVSDGWSLKMNYEGLFSDFTYRDSLFEMSTCSKIMSMLVEVGRYVKGIGNRGIDKRIGSALGYIHSHFGEDISIDKMAEMSDMSVSRFRALFRNQTGMSPKEYLTSLRISRAQMLIEQNIQTLKDISETVGYRDQLYFSRVFSEKTGMSPSEYKKKVSVIL